MKKNYILTTISILVLWINIANCQILCKANSFQENTKSDNTSEISGNKTGYYIIAGAFAVRDNATAFCSQLKEQGYNPSIIVSSVNHRNYVIIEYSQSNELLENKLQEIKKAKELRDAWILKISNDKEANTFEKTSSESIRTFESKNNRPFKKTHTKNPSNTHRQYYLIIKAHDDNNVDIPTTISIINVEKGKIISTVPSNKMTNLKYPKAENQTIKLSCENFGFHKSTLNLNLANPVNEKTLRTVKKSGDTIIVDLPLEKPKKGDIMVMYNVFFFPNSNAIRESSNYELEQLLHLFKENPELKIKIHGHTNGSLLGKFIKIKKDSDNLFSTGNSQKAFGTGKTLSRLRSTTVKKYLISNGVAKNRIKIKGWGGKRMIHKEYSPLAEYNVRVEVEVLKD